MSEETAEDGAEYAARVRYDVPEGGMYPVHQLALSDPTVDPVRYREAFAQVPTLTEMPRYLEFRAAAIAMKQANLTAIAAAERYKAALQRLSEAVAP